jgi:hypothetical protein
LSDFKRFEQALQNAEKAGDVEAARSIAAAMREAMLRSDPSLGAPNPIRLGQEAMPDAIRETLRGASRPAQVMSGVGSAAGIAGEGIKELFSKGDAANLENWRSVAGATGDTIGGNLLGNISMFGAGPTRLGTSAVGAVTKVPAWLASRPGMVADTAATAGLLNTLATPGDARERLTAGGMSLAASLGVPALYATGAGARRVLTRGGKRVSVGEGVLAEVGDEGHARLLDALRSPDPAAALAVSSSAAMRSGEPTLEVLERGSRSSRGDLWRDFDRLNAQARWNALTGRAGTPEELAHLKALRDSRTGGLRDEALENAQLTAQLTRGNAISEPMLKQFSQKLADWRSGKLRPNKDVQTLADYLEQEIKQGMTPEQLYEVRKVLTEGVKAGRTDQLSSSIKAARAQRMEVVGMIDDLLEDLSGGGWKDYLRRYMVESGPITSKQALQDIATSVKRGQPEGAVPTAMGESAAWKTLGNLRDRFGQKEFGSKLFDRLTPDDRELLNTLVDNLKRQSDVMSAKGVLGSHTAPLLASSQRAGNVTGILSSAAERSIPLGGILASNAFNSLGRKAEEELARLLQDPSALAEALEAAARARALAAGASRAGGASGGAAR